MSLPQQVTSDPFEKTLAAGIESVEYNTLKANFSETAQGAHTIFTVTGVVYVEVIVIVTTTFSGGNNVSIGTTSGAATVLANRATSELQQNRIWSTEGTVDDNSAPSNNIPKVFINNENIRVNNVTAITAGELDIYIRYQPISDGAEIKVA